MKGFLQKAVIAVLANAISLIVSTIVVLLVPKSISVTEYGFFQLYIFYSGYIGFFNFGWPEGIMLRYGGKKYTDLDQKELKTEVLLFSAMSIFIGLLLIVIAVIQKDFNLTSVIIGVALCVVLYSPRVFMQTIIHMTGRVNEYSRGIIFEKATYLTLVVVLLLLRIKSFIYYMIAELFGRLIALVYVAYESRDIINSEGNTIQRRINEIRTNISVGIKLMLANFAGIFIIGIVRQSIKSNWDIETFAKISLILSISNMLIACIRAVAIVLFPYLKRLNYETLRKLYKSIRMSLITPLFAMLILYFPLKQIMCSWLPNYKDSLEYMFLLFPICIYESKTSLLIETFMKTLRMEKIMMYINITSVLLSLLLSFVFVFCLNNLVLSVLSILILVAFRCIVSELVLSKQIDINLSKDIVIELIMVITFIIINWTTIETVGVLLYSLIFLGFLVYNCDEIKKSIKVLQNINMTKQ